MKRLSLSLAGFGIIFLLGVTRAAAQDGDAAIEFTSCPDSVAVGAPIAYALTGEILNQQLSGGITITDNLPAGLTGVTASAANHADHADPLCVGVQFCSVTGNTVTCSLPDTCMDDDLDADDVPVTDDFQTMAINGTAPNVPGPITVTSHAQSVNLDPNPLNNDDSCTTQVIAPGVPNEARLSITKTADANVVVLGTNVTYTLTVHNNGQLVAATPTVTDTLPAQLSFVSATTTAGTCLNTGNAITCNLSNVAVNANAVITVVANTLALGTVTNSATVASVTPDSVLADNTATATIRIISAGADLFVEKLADQSIVPVGSNVTYTLDISNFGPATAVNPVLTDVLPAALTFVSATVQLAPGGASMGTCSGTTAITCNLNSILSGNNATVTIVAKPNTAGSITNTATIGSVTSDPNPGNNTGSVTITATATAGNPVPTLTSLSPNTAVAGGPSFFMAITGTNFINGSIVRWNGVNLTTNFISSTQLTAPVPPTDIATAGTASVTVFNPAPGGGTSNALPFTITTGGAPVNPPTLTSLNPNSAPAGSATFQMGVTGTGFDVTSAVLWNGVALTTAFNSATTLTATVTANLVAAAGSATVSVLNSPTSGGASTNSLQFTITAGPPGGQPPFVVRQPTANPNPVNGGKTTQLDVLGGTFSSGGEAVLNYTWNITGPAPVNLSTNNGTNATKGAIAAFTALGTYTFTAHIVDTVTGLSVDTNPLSVTVNPGVGGITVSPKNITLGEGQLFDFKATVVDQFGAPFITAINWSASAGAISANSGAFTAPLSGAQITITASAQGKSDTALVTITLGGAPGDITDARAFPVPFKGNSGLPGITFTGLAAGSHIKIFTMNGRIVQTLDSATGGDVLWTLNNADQKHIASGVYLYSVESAGQKKEGKLVIIQ